MSDIPKWDAFPSFYGRWIESVVFYPEFSTPFGGVGRVHISQLAIPWTVEIDRLSYVVGPVSAGNVRMGLYREGPTADLPDGGGLIVESGSVAQIAAFSLHVITIPDTILRSGPYFLAVQGDDVTGTFLRAFTDNASVLARLYNQAYGPFTDPCPATGAYAYILSGLARVSRNLV